MSAAKPLQRRAEEVFGRLRFAPIVDQDVKENAILVDGLLQVVLLAASADEHLAEEPLGAWLEPATLDVLGKVKAKQISPLFNVFVA